MQFKDFRAAAFKSTKSLAQVMPILVGVVFLL